MLISAVATVQLAQYFIKRQTEVVLLLQILFSEVVMGPYPLLLA